jgi:endonuclease/exonuclease/phosphatase family metal-dependent hydrolase
MNIRFQETMRMRFVRGASAPRVVAIVPATFVHFMIICGWAWSVFTFQPYGNRQWTLTAIALVLVWLVAGLRSIGKLAPNPPTRLERIFGGSLWLGRSILIGVLTCSLGLVMWSALSRGGAIPPAQADPASIRVLTWNILHGSERGLPWSRYDWAIRKNALKTAIAGAKPDILCVQEALEEQLEFLAAVLPGHTRVGVGRDDGRSAGEHCAIFFDASRFVEHGTGTFWLEEPTDQPPKQTNFGPKRICTWVRLRTGETGRPFRIYNTHQYLTQPARLKAARLILARISDGDASDAVLVAGDFNAPPDTQDRRLFEAAGFRSSRHLAGATAAAPTYQFYGIRLRSLDDILVNRGWRVRNQYILDGKPGNTFPSDHFGVMADLMLELDNSHSPATVR